MRWGDERLPDRFWTKCQPEPNSDCWLWTGALNKGYGYYWNGSRVVSAHRLAYIVLVGSIPAGLELDHRCRVRCCCNPAHLEPVTSRENTLRGMSPVSAAARQLAKTHCPRGHAYAGENLHMRLNGARMCRACNRERERGRALRTRIRLALLIAEQVVA